MPDLSWKGETVSSTLSDGHAAQLVAQLPQNDFNTKLIQAANDTSRPIPLGLRFYLHKKALAVLSRTYSTPQPSAMMPAIEIYRLFDLARNYMPAPKWHYEFPQGPLNAVRIRYGNSRHPDDLIFTDGVWPDGRYYGRLQRSGAWFKARDLLQPGEDHIRAILTDPIATARSAATVMGRCVFCNRALDSPESAAVGYGPVCAKRLQLPWGHALVDPGMGL